MSPDATASFEEPFGLTPGTDKEVEQADLPTKQEDIEKHKELNSMLDDIFAELKSYREEKEKQWKVNVDAYRGRKAKTRGEGLSTAQLNNTWRIVNLYVAMLTDAKPRPEIGTRRPTIERLGKIMRDVVDAIFFLQELDRTTVRWSYDRELFGKAFGKCIWDPGLEWGEGDVAIIRADPRHMYIDNADSLKRSQVICYRLPVPLWELRSLFPASGQFVTADVMGSEVGTSGVPGRLPAVIRPQAVESRGIPRAWTEEWWIRDPQVDAEGNLRYPSGRLITRAGGNKTILVDTQNPYHDPWPGPWAEFNGAPDPDSPWPIPDVNMLVPLQDALDNMIRYMEDNASFLTAGMWFAERNSIDEVSLESKTSLLPKPGKVVWYRPGSKRPERDAGQPLPATLTDAIRMIYQGQESVSGLLDSSGGKIPRGVTAGSAIEQIQGMTQAAIRLASRDMEAGLAMIGQWTVNRVLERYTGKRVLNMLGPEGAYNVNWDPREFLVAAKGDQEELLKLFRFMITPGSSLALSKERQYALHAALYSMGAIDREALLTNIDYPGKEAIIKRMQMAQQGMPGAGARAGPTPRGRGAAVSRSLVKGSVAGGPPAIPGQPAGAG
jgi:hypothetical protein